MQLKLGGSRRVPVRLVGLGTVVALVVLGLGSTVSAQTPTGPDRTLGRSLPTHIADLKLETPEVTTAATADVLRPGVATQGAGKVVVRLSSESGATAWVGGRDEFNARRAARQQQEAFIARVKSIDPDARILGRVQLVMNAVFVEVDSSKLSELAKDPAVVRIAPVGNYKMDLSETVPYIGAAAVQKKGVTGKGIDVAVIDGGIDYTHKALGGSGNPDDYAKNDPNVIEKGTFPTKKVVGGYDFVGSTWDGNDPDIHEAPDPDPLDDNALNSIFPGHGTHVAHIIGGKGGVAPGVDLVAIKACSSVTPFCSGMALIQGMEFALDPNGDGRVRDRVDIINMSLGADYGQPFDDDLSLAVENATRFGTLTVAAAGNGGNKPYVTGTAAATPSALSVAQTQVPSAQLQNITVGATNYPAVRQTWSPELTTKIGGGMQYGDGAGGNLDGCAAFKAGSLVGKVVLVDRGTCNFTLKAANVSAGGAVAAIIGQNRPDAPFNGADGGDRPIDVPTFMISQLDADAIKNAGNGAPATLDPANRIPLVGQMVAGSSRGPQHENTQLIKPEIGAPGESVSAVAGSGTEEEPFGGTSGATPMVTGSAALVMDRFGGSKRPLIGRPLLNALIPGLSPLEVKARLMNNAETDIKTDPFTGLAPITRIGSGEVRVDDAIDARVVAWDDDDPTGALGFGFVDVTDKVTLKKTVVLRNYDKVKFHTYKVTPSFRFANDEASGAVTIDAPATVRVKPGLLGSTKFEVTLTIDGSKLPANAMSSGEDGANPAGLDLNEYDGYITLDDGRHPIHLPWHVLPRKAAKVEPSSKTINPPFYPDFQEIGLDNQGVGDAQNDAYALIAESPDIPAGKQGQEMPTPDLRAVGINTFLVPGGVCSDDPDQPSFVWAFAINTWERQEHLVPVSHWVYLDTNMDGSFDYAVINRDLTLNDVTDGRQLAWSVNLKTGDADAFFFAEHSTNTGNTIMYVCAEQIGMSFDDVLATNVGMMVQATDFYYGGPGDEITKLVVTPLGERFFGAPTDVAGNTNDPAGLQVTDFTPFPGNTDELGLMLVTNGDRGPGAHGGATQDTEALLLEAKS